jgi:hypothetical protein
MALIAPLVNGQYFAFTDITLRVNGLMFAGVKAVNYKDNLGRVKVRGSSAVPLGLTKGRYEANGDIEMYLDAFNTMVLALGAATPWRMIPFAISITYGPNVGMNLPLVTDIIPGAYLGEVDQSNGEGEDPISRKFTLHIPGQILWNGVPSIIDTSTLMAVA